MEPNRVDKPYMIEPVVHHNSDGPNSNGNSFHSSQDEDGFNRFNMDRNWSTGWVLYLYNTLTFLFRSSHCHMVSNWVSMCLTSIESLRFDT